MKILHLGKFYPPHHGGIETSMCNLAEAGVKIGHSVQCIVSCPGALKSYWDNINGVQVHRLATFGKLLSMPITPAFLVEPLGNSDLIHVHIPNPLAELKILFSSRNKKILPFVHALPLTQGKLGELWFSMITEKILNLSEKVLISNSYQIEAFPQLKKWKNKIRVVPFVAECISGTTYENLLSKRALSTTVVAVGRLVKYKGFDILLKAWAKFLKKKSENIKYSLKIVGDGPEKNNLLEIIKNENINGTVQMLGAVDDFSKNKILEEAILFVAPSINSSETFGISILEAMSKGLPVITTRLPTGVAALARGGECGAVVRPLSVEDLSFALQELLDAPRSRNEIGRQNLLYAKANHSPEVMMTAYEHILNSSENEKSSNIIQFPSRIEKKVVSDLNSNEQVAVKEVLRKVGSK